MLFIDLDGFKSVNDTYGHNVGDMFLKEIAEILKTSFRDVDTVGRWGGEEFFILCPQTDAEQAKILAEKLRIDIQKHIFDKYCN